MSNRIEHPTEDEVQLFSDEFDRIIDNTLFELSENGVKVRADVIMKDRNEGESSAVRVGASLHVSRLIESDPDIIYYDNPTDAELEEILARAANYTGSWYHSYVVLTLSGEWSSLQCKVAELDDESGIFLSIRCPEGHTLYTHPHLT